MEEENKHLGKWTWNLKKWFRRDNLIVLVLSGILLFIIALPTKEKSGDLVETKKKTGFTQLQSEGEQPVNGRNGANEGASTNTGSTGAVSGYDYAMYLEDKLSKALEGISGVGSVQVMLTLQSSEELVVEKDAPVSRSNTNETDAQGGNRVVSQIDTTETTIYRTDGNYSEPYVVKTILPKVEGVLVVAEGAGNGDVNKSITEIVQALFDVEAHKVQVVKMEVKTGK